jgi:hypothetical protein
MNASTASTLWESVLATTASPLGVRHFAERAAEFSGSVPFFSAQSSGEPIAFCVE